MSRSRTAQLLRYGPVVGIGRAVRAAARLRKADGGSAVPGLVVGRIAPGFLGHVLSSFPEGLVVVSGSAGKSTTTKMLVALLTAHGTRVFTNPSTANITQGLTSALLERVSLTGRIDADLAVLEMDEGHGARLASRFRSRLVLLTNVLTDQIDRFHDSEKVLGMLERIAATAAERVVLNGDDGMLARLPTAVPVTRFGVTQRVLDAVPHGLGYAATASQRGGDVLVESVHGRDAVYATPAGPMQVVLPAKGVHYAVDAAGAIAAAQALLGERFDAALAAATISAMQPVFGRGEIVTVRGQQVEFVLVQNPASFRLNLDELEPDLEQVMVAMGSDVRDPSYFWPVDTARLGRAAIVTGSKADEIAMQLLYQGVEVDEIEPDLLAALDRFLALPAPARGRKTIVFTADPMRRTRSHLGLAT